MLPDARELSHHQHARLDRLADEWPDAVVVGWHNGGPVVQAAYGRCRRVSPDGRMTRAPMGIFGREILMVEEF